MMDTFNAEAVTIAGIAGIVESMRPGYEFGSVSSRITDENFPGGDAQSSKGEVVEYKERVSSECVLADLESRGRRPANAAELFRYWKEHPECRCKTIVALGESWMDMVVVLDGDRGFTRFRHHAELHDQEGDGKKGWLVYYSFLSFPTSEEAAASEGPDAGGDGGAKVPYDGGWPYWNFCDMGCVP